MNVLNRWAIVLTSFLYLVSAHLVLADTNDAKFPGKATNEKLYVPAYSKVLTHENRSQLLASTVTVHNIDPNNSIQITRVDYYNQNGERQKIFLREPVSLAPFASRSFLVPMNDKSGGFGANFLVEWQSTLPVPPPIVEAIMIGGAGTQGISFTTSGRVIERQ